MEIVVLVKPVPEAEARLRPNTAGTDLDPEGVKWVLAGYDESAVEQALLLKESVPGSTVRAVALGPAGRTEETLRSALALGCDAALWIEAPVDRRPDALGTARALARALANRKPDLVLLGKQSGDLEEGLVGPALSELTGFAGYSFVTQLRYDPAAGRFTFERAVEGGSESYEAAPPLVVGLQQAWNDPRTAKLPNILKSRKAPIEKLAFSELGPGAGSPPASSRAVGFELPAPRTGAKMIPFKTPDEAARELVRILREEAKVFP